MTENIHPANADSAFEALHFDADSYLAQVQDIELSEDGARRFLEALWNIMVGFVDLGFDVSSNDGPVGQIIKAAIALDAESSSLLGSTEQFQDHKNDRTDGASKTKAQAVSEDS